MALPEPQDLVGVPAHAVGVVGLDRHDSPHVLRPGRLGPGILAHTDQAVRLRSIAEPGQVGPVRVGSPMRDHD